MLLLGSVVAYWIYARQHMDLVLWVAGVSGLGLCGLSWLAVGVVGLVLRLRWGRSAATRAATGRGEEGQAFATGALLPRWPPLPLLQVNVLWRRPAGAELRLEPAPQGQREWALLRRRGSFAGLEREVIVADLLGLAKVSWRGSDPAGLLVLPRSLKAPLPSLLETRSGEGLPYPQGKPEGDRIDLRAYQEGDPLRYVLWKVYARSRKLMVRSPERAVLPARRTLAFLVVSPDDGVAAALLRQALERGGLGDRWVFGADGLPGPVAEVAGALQALAASGNRERGEPGGLDRFLAQIPGLDQDQLLIFAGPSVGPRVAELAQTSRARGVSATLVLGLEALSWEASPEPRWLRLFLAPAADPAPDPEFLRGLLAQAGAAGLAATYVDAASGRSFGLGGLAAPRGEP